MSDTDYKRERDLLANAIAQAGIKSGLLRPDIEGLSGPQLLMVCDDLVEAMKIEREEESDPMAEPVVCPNCFWCAPQLPKEIGSDEQAEEYMRAEWRLNGGSMHGPNIETVTMPEHLYFRFRMGFRRPHTHVVIVQNSGQKFAVPVSVDHLRHFDANRYIEDPSVSTTCALYPIKAPVR